MTLKQRVEKLENDAPGERQETVFYRDGVYFLNGLPLSLAEYDALKLAADVVTVEVCYPVDFIPDV